MKKMLLAATAAAVVGGVAFAGNSAQAQEAEGFQLKLGGFYNALAVVRDTSDWAGDDKIRSYDFNQRGRWRIQGSQTLDNGMDIGFSTQYEIMDGMNNYDSYLFANGGFGRVTFGNTYGADYMLHQWAPSPGWGIDFTAHGQNLAVYPVTPNTYANRDMTFSYFTPRFGGFQAGFSFTPDQQNAANMNNRVVTNLSELNDDTWERWDGGDGDLPSAYTDLQNIAALGMNYDQSFDGMDLGLSAGVQTGELSQGAENILENEVGVDTTRAWSYGAGLGLGFGGLEVGANYRFDNLGFDDAKQHTALAGVSYTVDRFTFGPSFAYLWGDNPDEVNVVEEGYVADFGVRYAVAPGANIVGSVQHSEQDVDGGDDRSATAGLFGVQFSF